MARKWNHVGPEELDGFWAFEADDAAMSRGWMNAARIMDEHFAEVTEIETEAMVEAFTPKRRPHG